jgi:hypothetical protein
MKTKTLLLNTLLAIGLTASGVSFAADEPVVTPVQDPATVREQHRAETANMTQEQREAYRAEKQAAMTPEQRAAMRASGGNADKGKGTKARDGSGTGSQRGAAGGQGAGMGQKGR